MSVIFTFGRFAAKVGRNERIAVNVEGGRGNAEPRTIGTLPTLGSAEFVPPVRLGQGFHQGIKTLSDMNGEVSPY